MIAGSDQLWGVYESPEVVYLVRMNGADPQCAVDTAYSTNQARQIWCKSFSSVQEARSMEGQLVRTLTCGVEHQRLWGFSGYNATSKPGFWCQAVLAGQANIFPSGPPPAAGEALTLTGPMQSAAHLYDCIDQLTSA